MKKDFIYAFTIIILAVLIFLGVRFAKNISADNINTESDIQTSSNEERIETPDAETTHTEVTTASSATSSPEVSTNTKDNTNDKTEAEIVPAKAKIKNTIPLNLDVGSETVLINRVYTISSKFVPKNLSVPKVRFSFKEKADKRKMTKNAARALEKMFRAAKKDKITLYAVSGYRTYSRQTQIYKAAVKKNGKNHADTLSALPGSSEHQTGLAMDVSCTAQDCMLTRAFAKTKEGKWLDKNAHKFGYIIRYPRGKEKITGYIYEPWHIRYVGNVVANYIYTKHITLEEMYGVQDKVAKLH